MALVAVKGKTIFVTGHGGPLGHDMLRVPRFLDIRLTDGGKVVSLMRRPRFTPQEDSWYSFLLEADDPMAIVQPEGLGQLKKSTSSGLEPATFQLVT
jgi:hypothetical protein